MNNLYQEFSQLMTLDKDQQDKYFDKIKIQTELYTTLKSMLKNNNANYTNVFNNGIELTREHATDQLNINDTIGKYKISSLIGQGGMGNVYLANRIDGEYEQQVAIKTIPLALLGDISAQVINYEAQALAQLNHPNIVPIIDAGRSDEGYVYIVMQYIQGLTLSEYIQSNSLNQQQKLNLFIKLLDAVIHAHENQVLHRDLKPENIIIDENGDLFLLDFGISKLIGEKHDDNIQAYLNALSYQYASPEQKQGKAITTASDIYSLGKIIATLFINSSTPAISAIVTKSTDDITDNRYATVAELKQEIQYYLNNQPILAIQSVSYNSKLWFKRNSLAFAAAIIVIAGISIGSWQVYQSNVEANQQAILANQNLQLAETMLEQVDVRLSTETERQQALVDAAKTINIKLLPQKQAVRFTKSLADSYKAIGNYDAYQIYAQQLFDQTKDNGSFIIEHLIATKMLIELDVIYQRFTQAKQRLSALALQVKSLENKQAPALIELLDWEMKTLDQFLVNDALAIYKAIKPHLSAINISQTLNISLFEMHELVQAKKYKLAIASSLNSLAIAENNIKEIPIRYWVRHLIAWDTIQNEYDEPSDYSIFEEKVLNGLGDMEVLLDKNHPIVTSLALTVLNRLSARENKALFTLSEHFKDIKLDDLAPLYQITKGINDLNYFIDNGQHAKAYDLLKKLYKKIPLASADSIPLYQVFSYFVYDFGQYELMFNNHVKMIKLAEANNYLSSSSYYNSELCSHLAKRLPQKMEKACENAVLQATEIYGDDGFWTWEAKMSQFNLYRYNNQPELAKQRYKALDAAKNKFDGTWYLTFLGTAIRYQLQMKEVSTARELLDIYNTEVSKLTRSYGLSTRLYNAHVLNAENKIGLAKEALTYDISRFCDQWPYNHSALVELRRFRKELHFEPYDQCPNAVKWDDVVKDEAIINKIYAAE